MADYPDSIFTPRDIENRPGIVFDSSKKSHLYAEDIQSLDDEIVAIETELGLDPRGSYSDVAERLDAMLGFPVGVDPEPYGIPFFDDAGVLSISADNLNFSLDDNQLTVGGAKDSTPDNSTVLRVKNGNILVDNGHGMLALDNGGNVGAILAFTADNNLDWYQPSSDGQFRFVQGNEDGEFQFHYGDLTAQRFMISPDGTFHMYGTAGRGSGSTDVVLDPNLATDVRQLTMPDNDVLIASAVIADSVVTGSRAFDSNYTNSSNKALWVSVVMRLTSTTGGRISAKFNDNGSTDYSGSVGWLASPGAATDLNFQLTAIIPPGATYRLASSGSGSFTKTLSEWRERTL